jgi:hypothetical protein
MILPQAYYGEERGGHTLLEASEPGRFAQDLASRLDLPDTAPRGVVWTPFISGFPVGDFYVLARTSPDRTASRAGMVFTHAVFLPIDEAMRLADLMPLLRPLRAERGGEPLLNIEFTPMPPEFRTPGSELRPLVAALLSRHNAPVVFLGQDGFELRIAGLWARLLPALRRKFSFRLSFSPQDLIEEVRPAIVCTPPALAGRWPGFTLVDLNATEVPLSLAGSLLVGDEAGWPLQAFADETEAEIRSFGDLGLLEHAFELVRAPGDRPEQLIAAARLIEHLSAGSARGATCKVPLLERLAQSLRSAAPNQVLQLRNMALTSFPNAERVWMALEGWAIHCVWSQTDDADSMAVVAEATKRVAAPSAWQLAVRRGLTEAASSPESNLTMAVWRWAMTEPVVVVSLFTELRDARFDQPLSGAVPEWLASDVAGQVLPEVIQNGWLRTHAAVVAAAYPPLEAVRRQFAIDHNISLERILLAIARASSLELLTIAVQLKDDRLIEIAGSAVADNPALLGAVEFGDVVVQRIWATALRANPEVWRYPPDANVVVLSLMMSLVDGRSVSPDLIDAFARTPLANIENFPRRSELWGHLPDQSREKYLAATAQGWLRRFAQGSTPETPDPELEQAILKSPGLNTFLAMSIPGRVAEAAGIFLVLHSISDQRFVEWIRELLKEVPSLGIETAELIGRVVLQRHSDYGVAALVRVYSKRADLRPALRVCYPLLGLWDRFRLGIVPLSHEEKWQLLEDKAVELYYYGPDSDDLWTRSGGHNADLLLSGTARARWRDAIRRVRSGSNVRPKRLLKAMLDDFPNNEALRFLASNF